MKTTLLISLFVIYGFTSMAQGITFGPKIGYTAGKLSADQSDISTDIKSNFLFGAFLRLGNKVYIQPEINYFKSGTVLNRAATSGFSRVEDEIVMHNIHIPVLLGLKVADFKVANIRAMAGPTATLIVDKNVTPWQSFGLIKDADIEDFHWGMQFGIGADALMFTLDIQYYIGLESIIGHVLDQNDVPIKIDSRPQIFMITLGWKIL
jgi:hypothetical protein